MRHRLKFLLAVFLVLPLPSQEALSQTATRWQHPKGLYSLQPSRADARRLPAMSGNLVTWQVGPDAFLIRMCSVRETPIPQGVPIPQEELNHRLAALIGAAPDDFQDEEQTVTQRRTFERQGVVIAAHRIETDMAVMHEWIFAVSTQDGAVLEKIDCSGQLPISPEEETTFNAFLNSLTFSTTRPNP